MLCRMRKVSLTNIIMDRIDFDAKIETGGIIRIPKEYVEKLMASEHIHVTLNGQPPERATVRMMREEPLDAPMAKPLTRDELYDTV